MGSIAFPRVKEEPPLPSLRLFGAAEDGTTYWVAVADSTTAKMACPVKSMLILYVPCSFVSAHDQSQ